MLRAHLTRRRNHTLEAVRTISRQCLSLMIIGSRWRWYMPCDGRRKYCRNVAVRSKESISDLWRSILNHQLFALSHAAVEKREEMTCSDTKTWSAPWSPSVPQPREPRTTPIRNTPEGHLRTSDTRQDLREPRERQKKARKGLRVAADSFRLVTCIRRKIPSLSFNRRRVHFLGYY